VFCCVQVVDPDRQLRVSLFVYLYVITEYVFICTMYTWFIFHLLGLSALLCKMPYWSFCIV